jgi:hypothetical protein
MGRNSLFCLGITLDLCQQAIALIQLGLFAKGRIVSGNAVPAIRIQTG